MNPTKQIVLDPQPVLDSINSGLKMGGLNYLLLNWSFVSEVISQVYVAPEPDPTIPPVTPPVVPPVPPVITPPNYVTPPVPPVTPPVPPTTPETGATTDDAAQTDAPVDDSQVDDEKKNMNA